MLTTIATIPTLLLGVALLLAGNGFLGTLLAVRAGQEGFPSGVIGLIMSGYFGGFVVGTHICPRLIHRVGHIRTFASLAAITSTATVLHGFAVHPFAWLILRIAVGFCLVGIYMVIESWMNVIAVPGQRGSFFSVYMTTALLALGAGQFLLLFNTDSPLVPFALASMFFTLGLVPIALTRVPEPKPLQTPPSLHLKGLFAQSPSGVIGAAVAGVLTGSFWGLGPVFAAAMNASDLAIASFMGVTVFGGVALQWPIGYYSDTRDRRKVLALASALGAIMALGAYFLSWSSPVFVVLFGFLLGGFLFSVYSLSVAHVNDALAPGDVLEGTRRLLLLNGLGAAAGPLIAGILMQGYGSRSLMIFVAVVFSAFALYGARSLRVPPRLPVEDQVEFVPMTRTSPAVLELHPEGREPGPGQD